VLHSLQTFGFALLADAVGLGKTYVALAVAATYRQPVAVVPAAIASQWRRVSVELGIDLAIHTHEAMSRGRRSVGADLIITDEAHRFRNPNTRRYDVLARMVGRSHLLLLTATAVVNGAADLVNLTRLALPDDAFAIFGLPSLERAMAGGQPRRILHASAAVITARGPNSIPGLRESLPKLTDGPVLRPPPASHGRVCTLVRAIGRLQFPSMSNSAEAALLRLNLLHRLASSTDACRQTVLRHLIYTDRAIEAAERGECLPRAAARRIFSFESELQLDLQQLPAIERTAAIDELRDDRRRLKDLLALLTASSASPKTGALKQLLNRRGNRKTIVFTVALATAHMLARALRWQRVAVVGSGRAWIATGRLAVDEALALFAPTARCAPNPPASSAIQVLLATDLLSEGLDLQDADAVVHYDLPWTPLRLQQRVGRVARLGSTHDVVDIRWFAPPKSIECRLAVERRVAAKASCQLGLQVAVTSRVGKAQQMNFLLEQREALGMADSSAPSSDSLYAVVRGPQVAVLAVRWTSGTGRGSELFALAGNPPEPVSDYGEIDALIRQLSSSPRSHRHPPAPLLACIVPLVRSRLAAADRGPVNQATRRLARQLVRLAYAASKMRDLESVNTYDAVLDRLRRGVAVGAERTLEELCTLRGPLRGFTDWLDGQPQREDGSPTFTVVAALIGDGSVTSSTGSCVAIGLRSRRLL
jgi:superfamily II DNA or RNA helicase